jgi:hypothetical protein
MRGYRENYLLEPRGPPHRRQDEYVSSIRRIPRDYARFAPYKARTTRWAPPKRSTILSYEDVAEIENMPRSVHLPNLPTDVTVAEITEWCDRAINSLRKSTEASLDPAPAATKCAVEHVTLLTGSHRRWMANITLLDPEHRNILKEGAKTVELREGLPTLEVRLLPYSRDSTKTNSFIGSELYPGRLQRAKQVEEQKQGSDLVYNAEAASIAVRSRAEPVFFG